MHMSCGGGARAVHVCSGRGLSSHTWGDVGNDDLDNSLRHNSGVHCAADIPRGNKA